MRKIFKKPPPVGIDFPPLRENGNRSTARETPLMVKGISRRVVVVDAPEHRFFEQAIFIVRNDAAGEGITSRELVEEARRVAHNYASSGTSRFSSRWRTLNPIVYTLIGAGTIGLAWLIVALA